MRIDDEIKVNIKLELINSGGILADKEFIEDVICEKPKEYTHKACIIFKGIEDEGNTVMPIAIESRWADIPGGIVIVFDEPIDVSKFKAVKSIKIIA
jgi:hypothetical protein